MINHAKLLSVLLLLGVSVAAPITAEIGVFVSLVLERLSKGPTLSASSTLRIPGAAICRQQGRAWS